MATARRRVLSYGNSTTEGLRVVGTYAGRILKGESPANLPIQQATKIELFLNLKTANARWGSPFRLLCSLAPTS
jgi:hypothetical protein